MLPLSLKSVPLTSLGQLHSIGVRMGDYTLNAKRLPATL